MRSEIFKYNFISMKFSSIISPSRVSTTDRIRADLALLLAATVWGTGFAAQRVAAAHIGIFLFNGIRFLIGALVMLMVLRFRLKIQRQQLPWVLLAGGLLFCAGSFQQAGLQTTTASNAGFITGLYTILVPIVLLVGWRKQVDRRVWAAAAIAVAGSLFLSLGGYSRPVIGDLLELGGALMWAFHIIVITRLANLMNPIQFNFSQLFVGGMLNLTASFLFEGYASFGAISPIIFVVLYSGLIPVGIGFTLQVVGQKHAPPADAALIMSMEAVFGAISGFIFLGETMAWVQILGCSMIFGAIILSQYAVLKEG